MAKRFLDTILVCTSDAEQRQRAKEKMELQAELVRAVNSCYPELTVEAVCAGLTAAQCEAVHSFLQFASVRSLTDAVQRKTLKFSSDKVGTAKVETLHKRGFPVGDFTWSYNGVMDFGPNSTERCSLSGHSIRYGHTFVAKGALALCLSSGSASSLFGIDKEVFDSVIYARSGLLQDVAEALCAGKLRKVNEYLLTLCGSTGAYISYEGFNSISDLIPFHVEPSLLESGNVERPVDASMVRCQYLTGEISQKPYGWICEHIYSCLNANLDESFDRLIPGSFSAKCIADMRSMVSPIIVASKFLSAGLLPPVALCAAIDAGLAAGIMCHRVPESKVNGIEDVKDNWEYSIDGDVLTLKRYIGTSPDVVVRNTYMAEGKQFTKVALMETKVTLDSAGVVDSVDVGVLLGNKGLKSIVFEEGIILPEKCWFMFEGCSSLTFLDLSSFDTSSVTCMWNMFRGCSSLTSLDLSHFDTSSVTDMASMFHGCSSLTSLDLSSFDTSKVTDMEGMFVDCSSLTSLDLSSFDTSCVTFMLYMFSGCSSLTSLDLSSFDTSKVDDMDNMFEECSVGILYFWGTRKEWDALESKPKSVGTLICKDASLAQCVCKLVSVLSSRASGVDPDKIRVFCTVRLKDVLKRVELDSIPVHDGFVPVDSGITGYVDEADPSLVRLWVPINMVSEVVSMFGPLGSLIRVSDTSGRVIRSFDSGVSTSFLDSGELEKDLGQLDMGSESDSVSIDLNQVVGTYESEGYRRLYSLVEDAYRFFTCDVDALRALGDEYAGKTDIGIRRSQLFEVKVLDPVVECALYARELRYPLPDGVQLSSAGLSVLAEYESSKRASRVVLNVLRTECFNAGLLFTASPLLKGVLELLLEDDVRVLLKDVSEEMLVDRLVQLLSNYQIVRSGVLTVLVGLYRMVEVRGTVALKNRIGKLYNAARAGSIPAKKVSVQGILDSAKGN